MRPQRSALLPHERRRCLEAAILALVLAEDWPWRAPELAAQLSVPVDAIRVSAAVLRADGLLTGDGERLRASWAAVRGDELACWRDSNKRPVHRPLSWGTIPIH